MKHMQYESTSSGFTVVTIVQLLICVVLAFLLLHSISDENVVSSVVI